MRFPGPGCLLPGVAGRVLSSGPSPSGAENGCALRWAPHAIIQNQVTQGLLHWPRPAAHCGHGHLASLGKFHRVMLLWPRWLCAPVSVSLLLTPALFVWVERAPWIENGFLSSGRPQILAEVWVVQGHPFLLRRQAESGDSSLNGGKGVPQGARSWSTCAGQLEDAGP